MEISVVIPAYNEEKVIISTLKEVRDFLENNFSNYEIIVVDDCSKDSTFSFISSFTGLKVLRNLKNHGKGYSIAKGVAQAQGDWILFMDADNSTKIKELLNFFPYKKDYQLIIASRALKDSKIELRQNFVKVFLGKIGNFFSRLLIDRKIKDTQCGFKFFSRDLQFLFDKMTIRGFAFDFELIFLARKHGFKVKEIGVTWQNNFDSSVRWHDYPQTFFQILKIRVNDLLGKYN